MTTSTTNPTEQDSTAEPPTMIHFLASGLTIQIRMGWGKVMRYGDQLPITPEVVEANKDRNGRSWLELVDDEPAQVRRFGKVAFRRGPWPSDLPRYEPGSFEHAEAREIARAKAHELLDPKERAKALRAVEVQFGRGPTTNRTIANYRDDEARR